jgi:hypothetical protein
MITKIHTAIVASAALVAAGSTIGWAQQPPPQSPNMTFFVTSAGPGKGLISAAWKARTVNVKCWRKRREPVTRPGTLI